MSINKILENIGIEMNQSGCFGSSQSVQISGNTKVTTKGDTIKIEDKYCKIKIVKGEIIEHIKK